MVKSAAAHQPEALGSLYEIDEPTWLAGQAEALREGRMADVDHVNLAEFLDEMAARDRRELRNRFVVLLHHMLKWHYQPERRCRSWLVTILREQDEVSGFLGAESINQYVPMLYSSAWPPAVHRAMVETGLSATAFPRENPWDVKALVYMIVVPSNYPELPP